MKKIVFSILLFALSFIQSNAQDLRFEKIGIKEGLPHYYTEYVFEDSKGFLWIGTLGGLVKYDGKKMKTFTTKDGLISNNIITINEDRIGNIWIGTNNGVVKINDKITSYEFGDNKQATQQIFVSSDSTVYAANLAGTYLYNSKLDSFVPHPIMGSIYTRTIIEDDSNNIWFGGIEGLFKTYKDTVVQMVIPGEHKNYHNSIVSSMKDCYGSLWFGTASGFAQYINNSFYTFDQEIGVEYVYVKLFQLQDSSYIFGTYGGGVVSFKDPKNMIRQYLGVDGVTQNTVHGIEQTKGGAIWLATGSQLLKSKKQVFSKIEIWPNETPLYPYEITKNYQGQYWIATNKGVVMFDNKNQEMKHIELSEDQHKNSVISILADNQDSSILIGTYSGICYQYKNKLITTYGNEKNMVEGQSVYGIYKDTKGNTWLSKNIKVLRCNDFGVEEVTLDTLHIAVFETLEDDKNNIWFATGKGLFLMNNDNIQHIQSIDGNGLGQLRQIEIDLNGNLWLGSTSKGIFKYAPETQTGVSYSVKDGLTSNFIQSLKYDKSFNCIWVGTINGITKVELDTESTIKMIREFKIENILECNVNSIYCDKDDGVFIGVGDYLYNYNPKNDVPNTNIPIVRLENIQLFNRDFDYSIYTTEMDSDFLPKDLVLPFDKNHLTFNFYGIELNQPKNVTYSIKLEGFDKEWSESKNNRSVTYNNLPPNSYVIKIKAKNSDGLWSSVFKYSFLVDSPFYKKYWFILSGMFLFGLIVFTFVKKRIKKIKGQAEIEKNIAQLELKALRAQMNPHFIFNIMNNIQNLVVTQQANKAIQLLGDFAKLIRSILDISSDKTIVLSKEIEFLKTYIELDLTQYPNKYDYEFNFSDNIDEDNLLIPPILIQPFVENAILHGLMHRENFGLLKISFSQTKTSLICVVEDNGVGRRRSQEISVNKQDHKSKALNISKDRINQFNRIEKSNQYNIIITDVKDQNNNCIGTKAKIEIPLIFKY